MTDLRRIILACAALAALARGVPAGAQGTAAKPAPPPAAAPATKPVQQVPVEPLGYTYNAAGRRDPFVSLLRSGSDGLRSAAGTRPAGLAGLSTSEVALKGTMQSATGYVGLLQGADNKTYIVRQGDRLLDGTIRTITANTIVILQQVSDPLSLQKEREIRKVLRQADEVK